LERGIAGAQRRGFKMFEQLQLQDRYKLKLIRQQKRNGNNTMENFGMSKVARVKKEQKWSGEVKGQMTTKT